MKPTEIYDRLPTQSALAGGQRACSSDARQPPPRERTVTARTESGKGEASPSKDDTKAIKAPSAYADMRLGLCTTIDR